MTGSVDLDDGVEFGTESSQMATDSLERAEEGEGEIKVAPYTLVGVECGTSGFSLLYISEYARRRSMIRLVYGDKSGWTVAQRKARKTVDWHTFSQRKSMMRTREPREMLSLTLSS